jgi:membrane associated rhomboid family serine protease
VIPLRDSNPTRSTPVLTYLIIAINTLVYFYQASLGPEGEKLFVERFGLIPAMLAEEHYLGSLVTPLTSMFMHGGLMHLLLNMWSLFIFGDNVEDTLGKTRFLVFYIASGLGAAAAQVFVDPSSMVPMVGASGAIAGVLAAYLRLFPHARVLTLIPLFIFFFTRELPAVFFIAFWFLMQVLSGVGSLSMAGNQASGGVAFFAHIGGFLMGLVLVGALTPQRNVRGGFRRPEHYRS